MDPNLDHHEYCTVGFDPDDIVISGMAGRFPECGTVGELKEGLYSKKNLIVFSDARFEKGTLGLPYSSYALLKELDKFDAEFFHCAPTLANQLDPAARIHMEVTYEAIADAGVDAIDLKGQRIGVFNATTADDSNKIWEADEQHLDLTMRSMNSNRTSYALGFTGPSMVIDTACSSSGVALWAAVQSIQAGCVEAAVVSGCQLNLRPESTLKYLRMGMLSPTGNSRPFDSKADGFMRGESVCAVFLQKAKLARRAYATIKASRFNFAGYVLEGIGVPSKNKQIEIMKDVLSDAKVDPDEIQFVEGHGTGTLVGDPIEANAIGHVFTSKTRNTPLLLGSLKSNIGHTEACAGLCGVIKSLLAFETGLIPPNINYEAPNPDSPALLEGSVSIVTESTPLTADYIPLISLGFGGTLSAVVLKKNPRTYEGIKPVSSEIPRIVLYPATTQEAVITVFDYITNNPDLPKEFFALLNKLSFTDHFYKPFRGYAIYQKGKSPVTQIKVVFPCKRQVWYIMTGMGCQWPGMGLQLMKIDKFASSMKKSAEILKEYGVDLFEILRADGNYFHKNRKITASFVAIISIQIALIDVLKLLGVAPDGIIGYSLGELTAAYADGACTHEQSLIASYISGQAFESANLQEGGMIAVDASWSQAQKLCPKDVYPAFDNADDSVTISGLKEPLEKFVEKLKQDKVSVRMVNSHGFGSHCKLVHDVAPLVKQSLKKIIPDPKPRSERWLSTSYPESEWNSPDCNVCGPEYFSNNIVSCVRFTETLKKVPSDAIIIEIGPHFLLQSILKRVVGSKASYHGLMKRNGEDNMVFFMESLGSLYHVGLNPKIELLYPAVKFPVPRGTPMISDIIKWNHSQSFIVPRFSTRTNEFSREFKFDKVDAYLLDHKVGGRTLFPAAGFVYLAWEALAMKHHEDFKEMPVIIQDFEILKSTITNFQSPVKFSINIQNSSGRFEIMEGESLVARGKICQSKNMMFLESPPEHIRDDTCVSGQDIYDELKISGYEYGPAFRNIIECNLDGTSGLIQWEGRWITLLEVHLLFFSLVANKKGTMLPTAIEFLKIDPNVVRTYIRENASTNKEPNIMICDLPCSYNPKTKVCRSVGVEVGHLKWETTSVLLKAENPILEEYRFVPYVSGYTPTVSSSLQFSQYFFACNELLKKIETTLKDDAKQSRIHIECRNNIHLDEIESSKNKNLLKILETISKDLDSFKNNRKEYLATYSRIAGKDILNNVLVNEDSLKILLAIIFENTYRKLNVVEVNRNFPVVLILVTEIAQKYAYPKLINSILISLKSVAIDQEVLEERGIQQSSYKSLKDFEKERSQDVVISSFTYGSLSELKKLIRTLNSLINPNGFILLFLKEKINEAEQHLSSICGEQFQVRSVSELEEVLKSENLLILSKISDPFGGSVYLLRAPNLEEPQRILQITDGNYDWVGKVKKELYGKDSGILWLVAEDSPVNGILGLVNCLKQESAGERIRCVFISREKHENHFPPFSMEHPVFKHLITRNLAMNVYKIGTWGSYRHILMKEIKPLRPVEHCYVDCREYGDLSSFEWIESSVKYASRQNQKLVHIYYAAVNFKDMMMATGQLSIGAPIYQHLGKSSLGFEFSGREEDTGKRICGLVPAGAMATSILIHPVYCLEIPQNLTMAEAATIPVVYVICYYSLITRAKLQPTESILIHSGSSEIGIAAITIALSLKCDVFTTVGNDEKRDYLKRKFPQIKDENIGCSRNISFETMILSRTNGRGVDVILNSFVDDKYQANFRCIARSGRIIEIGKHDVEVDRSAHSKIFLKNASLHAVYLDEIFDVDSKRRGIVQDTMDMVREGIKSGTVQPLDRTIFDRSAMEDAFTYMAKGGHVGKVLLKIRDEEPDNNAMPKTLMLPAVPDTHFYYNKVYIIIGGLGGFGIEVAKWMTNRGARNIILTSRYGARTPYHHFCLKRWKDEGVNIQLSTLNVAKRNEAEKILKEAMRIGPLGGIFNSAVVLKDAFMDVQTSDHYKMVCGPKSEATKILDELTRQLCPDIDYFVCFSSIVAGRGYASLANYGYANSAMDRICEERRKDGLHGLSVQWGRIGDVGLVHRRIGEDTIISGLVPQRVKCCLQTLNVFCQQDCPVVASCMAAEQSKKSVQENAFKHILKILEIEDITQMNMTRKLSEIGIDSIVGAQIKEVIEFYSDVVRTMQEILEMKLADIKVVLENSCSEKAISKAPAFMATADIKLPPALTHNDSLVVLSKGDSGEPIFIVHLKDSDVMSLQSLTKAVNSPVYALVWTKDLPSTDMESVAQWYLKLIQNITDGPYHLMGVYEGSCLAFEMALQSERMHKRLKSLTLIDGSQHLMNTLTRDNAEKTEPEVRALCGFIEQFTTSDVSRLKGELQSDLNLDQRIRTVFNYITDFSDRIVNKNELSEAVKNYLLKQRLLESYIPNEKLSSDISLLEDSSKFLESDVAVVQKIFSQICSGKATIHRVFSTSLLSTEEGVKQLAATVQSIVSRSVFLNEKF